MGVLLSLQCEMEAVRSVASEAGEVSLPLLGENGMVMGYVKVILAGGLLRGFGHATLLYIFFRGRMTCD
jgi:hypothetical protein